jgi:hypothetical protein
MEAINYWKMTNDELKKLCEECRVEFNPTNRKETINKIKAAKGELVSPEDERVPVADKKDFVVVQFHNKDENDLPYVPVGLNGKFWYIPKERPVLIPRVILGVINDAVEVSFIQKKSPDGKLYLEEKKVYRFPYTVITTAPPRE